DQNQNETTTFIVLVCLLVVEVKGDRCICADKGVNKVSRKAIEKVEIILPRAGQKCLNPGSRFTKKYILTAIQKMSACKYIYFLEIQFKNINIRPAWRDSL
uniref:Chemokine interleukin-8-like domain-containing protein n=1 Tax=Sinocyclocheilus grahami TaxID=75366 RepID=A0A672MS55_SINGR